MSHLRRSLSSLALLLAACTGPEVAVPEAPVVAWDQPAPVEAPDPDEVVLSDDLVILDDHPCVTDVDAGDLEALVFELGCDAESVFEPGDVVAGTADGGYLRRVESLAFRGDSTVIAYTTEASLSEVVEQGGFSISLSPETGERSMLDFSNTVLFADRVMGSDVLFRLNRGVVDLTPNLDIDGHWADGAMQNFDFDTSFEVYADLEAVFTSSNGLRREDSFDLWAMSFPFATAIGPLPVAGEVTIKLKVGYRVDAPGQVMVTAGAEGRSRWETARHYRDGEGWSTAPEHDLGWDVQPPEITVGASTTVRTFLRFETSVDFFKVVGPSLQADVYASISAEAECDGIAYEADAGLAARAQIKMNILNKFRPTKTFATVDLTADLTSGTLDYPIGFPLPCEQPEIRCGDLVDGNTAFGEADLDGYTCNVGNYSAPEIIYEWVADRTGTVEWALVDPTPTRTDHDVIVLEGFTGLVSGTCNEWGSNSVEFEAVQGRTYYLVVDGYNADSGSFQAELSCN